MAPQCTTRSGGHEQAAPERFDDRFWVQALQPLPNGRVLALVSHEYMGKRHPGHCERADKSGPQCWYSSILEATASEADFRFTLPALAQRVVAASPLRFDPAREARSGFLTTTNIVAMGEWLYMASWAEFPGTRGNCLFRNPRHVAHGSLARVEERHLRRALPQRVWRHAPRPPDAIRSGPIGSSASCARSCGSSFTAPFVGVFSVANGTSRTPGTYYALSDDLTHWGDARLLASAAALVRHDGLRGVLRLPLADRSAEPVPNLCDRRR